jgi:hypothetical protein
MTDDPVADWLAAVVLFLFTVTMLFGIAAIIA